MKLARNAMIIALVLSLGTLGTGIAEAAGPMDQCKAQNAVKVAPSRSKPIYASKDWQQHSRMMPFCPMTTKGTVTTNRKVYSKGSATVTQSREVASMEGCHVPGRAAANVSVTTMSCCQ